MWRTIGRWLILTMHIQKLQCSETYLKLTLKSQFSFYIYLCACMGTNVLLALSSQYMDLGVTELRSPAVVASVLIRWVTSLAPTTFLKGHIFCKLDPALELFLIGSCTHCLSYVIENYKNLKTKPKLFFLLLLFSQSNQTTMKSPQELVFT